MYCVNDGKVGFLVVGKLCTRQGNVFGCNVKDAELENFKRQPLRKLVRALVAAGLL